MSLYEKYPTLAVAIPRIAELEAERDALVEGGNNLILAADEYGLNRCWGEAKESWKTLLSDKEKEA